MKRKIEDHCTFSNKKESATVIIDKNGMRLEDKDPSYKSDCDFIRSFLSDCINMDSWKHSWHMDVGKAHSRRSKERKKVREILLGKIETRENEIKLLKDAVQILGRWHW